MSLEKHFGIRPLCPTRWTVRADSLASITENYSSLQSTWDEVVDITRDSEIKARIIGVAAQMKTFEIAFAVHLAEMLFRHTDNLSKTLQKDTISEGQIVASMMLAPLQSVRNDESFQLFWDKLSLYLTLIDVSEPRLPRQRKIPKRFDDGTASTHFHDTPTLHYRQVY